MKTACHREAQALSFFFCGWESAQRDACWVIAVMASARLWVACSETGGSEGKCLGSAGANESTASCRSLRVGTCYICSVPGALPVTRVHWAPEFWVLTSSPADSSWRSFGRQSLLPWMGGGRASSAFSPPRRDLLWLSPRDRPCGG